MIPLKYKNAREEKHDKALRAESLWLLMQQTDLTGIV